MSNKQDIENIYEILNTLTNTVERLGESVTLMSTAIGSHNKILIELSGESNAK